MSEGRWREEQQRGRRAAEILEDDVLIGAFDEIEQEAISEWRSGGDPQSPVALNAWHRLQALEAIKGKLQSIMDTGRLAAQSLEIAKNGTARTPPKER
ncbi:hypothetical protein [Burkholderia stagnalis]|uniref:hypothetical protein n=1 Tax=Burkholderia stagnalis TaxID=1503054 RepID=UPI000752AB4A|nr:hypothetical protein [Burkholderia stagnalis]KVL90769.1 hypothetical protein WT02_23180 [Burkholderia stagnalis]KVL93731.1 hypothetical protein WT03_14875 [Burkholderia stagnalis]KVM02154.1 hypothetical protein WT04_30635 [Burkholderia stagnalis]